MTIEQHGDLFQSSTPWGLSFHHLQHEAEPAVAELIPVLAPVIYEASRPFADWYFGEPDVAAEIITEWMARPTAEVFVGRAMIAEAEDAGTMGCLIGLSGADLADCRRADFAAFCADLGSGPEADEVLEQVVTAARELFPPVEADELYISRVAVRATWRNRGVGRALVGHACETYRRRGFRKCRLDVGADNIAAIRAYQAVGLRIIATSSSPTCGLSYCAMAGDL